MMCVEQGVFSPALLASLFSMPLTFDVVVVGSGASGCACVHGLLKHLPADSSLQIALIEQGTHFYKSSTSSSFLETLHHPHKWGKLWGSRASLDFYSTAQEGLHGRVVRLEQGQGVGGSTLINAFMWVNPTREDCVRWTELHGCEDDKWCWEEVHADLEEMLSSTCIPIVDTRINEETSPIVAQMLECAAEVGYRTADSSKGFDTYNNASGDPNGAWFAELSLSQGQRVSAYDAFLREHESNPQFSLSSEVNVTRLALEQTQSDQMRCTGVYFRNADGVEEFVSARVSVILACGSLLTPTLLMRSGIGPSDHLAECDIECLLNSPRVGANLSDHTICPMLYMTNNTMPGCRETNGQDGIVFFGMNPTNDADDRLSHVPNTKGEFVFTDLSNAFQHFLPHLLESKLLCPSWIPWMNNTRLGSLFLWTFRFLVSCILFCMRPLIRYFFLRRMAAFFVILSHPTSRGSIRLSKDNPLGDPLIDPSYMSTSDEGHFTREILPWSSMWSSQPRILKHICAELSTSWHFSGTCAMGSHDAVVSSEDFSVRGCNNLRVADLSVVPEVVAGNTQAVAYLVGYRCGKWIAKEQIL